MLRDKGFNDALAESKVRRCIWYRGTVKDVAVHQRYLKKPKEKLSPPLVTPPNKRVIHRILVGLVNSIHGVVVLVNDHWL